MISPGPELVDVAQQRDPERAPHSQEGHSKVAHAAPRRHQRRRFHRPLPFCPGEEFEQFFRVVVGSALKKRLQGDVAQEGAAFVAAACK